MILDQCTRFQHDFRRAGSFEHCFGDTIAAMKSAKRRNDSPWVVLCCCLFAAGLSLFGLEGLEADETPVEIHSVLLQPGSGDEVIPGG